MQTWQESACRSRAKRPDVHVVDFLHSFDAQHRRSHVLQTNLARQTFQQNVAALAQNSLPRPEDHRADADANHRVNPLRARPANGQRAHKDRHVR